MSASGGGKPARPTAALITGSDEMILNPDHITIAVADAGPAIAFFALLGFKKDHVATIDGGVPARYMGMPAMKAQTSPSHSKERILRSRSSCLSSTRSQEPIRVC